MHALVFSRHDRSFAAICGASCLTASICRNEIVVVVKQFSYDLLIHLRLRKTYYICKLRKYSTLPSLVFLCIDFYFTGNTNSIVCFVWKCLYQLLDAAGIESSYVYSTLDQAGQYLFWVKYVLRLNQSNLVNFLYTRVLITYRRRNKTWFQRTELTKNMSSWCFVSGFVLISLRAGSPLLGKKTEPRGYALAFPVLLARSSNWRTFSQAISWVVNYSTSAWLFFSSCRETDQYRIFTPGGFAVECI